MRLFWQIEHHIPAETGKPHTSTPARGCPSLLSPLAAVAQPALVFTTLKATRLVRLLGNYFGSCFKTRLNSLQGSFLSLPLGPLPLYVP